MANKEMYALGSQGSAIRELFAYGQAQAAKVGKENVFDFSGINEYTNDIHNYYERGHYRPILGARLLQKVYANHN